MGITDYDMHVLSKASGSNPVDIHRPVEILSMLETVWVGQASWAGMELTQ